jgi:hypothetical protein
MKEKQQQRGTGYHQNRYAHDYSNNCGTDDRSIRSHRPCSGAQVGQLFVITRAAAAAWKVVIKVTTDQQGNNNRSYCRSVMNTELLPLASPHCGLVGKHVTKLLLPTGNTNDPCEAALCLEQNLLAG